MSCSDDVHSRSAQPRNLRGIRTPQHDHSFSRYICPVTNVVEQPTLRCQRPECRQCAIAAGRTPPRRAAAVHCACAVAELPLAAATFLEEETGRTKIQRRVCTEALHKAVEGECDVSRVSPCSRWWTAGDPLVPLIKEEVATKESRVEKAGEDIEVVFESKTRMRNARLVCRVREAEGDAAYEANIFQRNPLTRKLPRFCFQKCLTHSQPAFFEGVPFPKTSHVSSPFCCFHVLLAGFFAFLFLKGFFSCSAREHHTDREQVPHLGACVVFAHRRRAISCCGALFASSPGATAVDAPPVSVPSRPPVVESPSVRVPGREAGSDVCAAGLRAPSGAAVEISAGLQPAGGARRKEERSERTGV